MQTKKKPTEKGKLISEKSLKYEGAKGVPVMRGQQLGSAVKTKTGLWRTKRPVIDYSKCIACKRCWLMCPEGAIKWNEKLNRPEINYDICKGCLICAEGCPVKTIKVKDEPRG